METSPPWQSHRQGRAHTAPYSPPTPRLGARPGAFFGRQVQKLQTNKN